MKLFLIGFLFSLLSLFSVQLWGQFDETLFKGASSPAEAGLSSGRYKSGPPVRYVPEDLKISEESKPIEGKLGQGKKKEVRRPALAEVFTPSEPEEKSSSKETTTEDIDAIHPDDIRLNQVEIGISSGLLYNQASSSYSYRQYTSFAPQMSLSGAFWTTKQLGIFGSTLLTQGADVTSDPSTRSKAAVTHELTKVGLRGRKFFGGSRKSNSIEYGLIYSSYKLSMASDEPHRGKIKTTGVGLLLSTRVPTSPSYSHVFGAEFFPRMVHQESATALNLQSGSGADTTKFAMNFGGEFKLSREHQVVWGLEGSLEKNLFGGSAQVVDPETGTAPTGVSVSNSIIIFTLGYRWGH